MVDKVPQEQLGRFSARTSARLGELGKAWWSLTDRHLHVREVRDELARITRGKLFAIHHWTAWRMVSAERDNVAIAAASLVRSLWGKGGFLRSLQGPDLRAVGRRWNEDRLEQHVRLFPSAADAGREDPIPQDVAVLEWHLQREFEPLLDDRDNFRAHPFETAKRRAHAKELDLVGLSKALSRLHQFLADLHSLGAANSYPRWDTPSDELGARDLVDLILLGNMRWIVVGAPGFGRAASVEAYEALRGAHYAELHAAHDAQGAPVDVAFNQ
jgi:hypothetical protein